MKLEAGKWYLNENGGKRYVASTCALGPQPVIVQEELTYFLMAGIPSAIPCMGAQSGPHTTYRFHLHNADGTPASEADRKAGYSLVRECKDPPVVDWSAMSKSTVAVAMDRDGTWHEFLLKPSFHGDGEWLVPRASQVKYGWMQILPPYTPQFTGDWRDSLVERPREPDQNP